MSRRLLLATGNAHKVAEVAEILGPAWDVVARDPGVEETGDTFEANALLKARALRDDTGELAVADDSGIVLATLVGVYPANIQMCLEAEKYPQIPGGRTTLLMRLPLQFVMGFLVWKATLSKDA